MTRRDQRGVTVVELMVAMFLLAVALIGLAASFPYAMYGVSAGGYQTTATLLAQQSIDRARNTKWADLCNLPAGEPAPATMGYTGFTRAITVSPCPNTAVTTVTVEVVVEFQGPSGIAPIYSTTVTTVIAS